MREKLTWVRAGHLLDGSGGPALNDVVFAIRNGRFGPVPDTLPQNTRPGEIMDLSSCTVIPGLVDCHVHLLWSGTPDREARKRQMFPEKCRAYAAIEENLNLLARAGVVAVRDGGDATGLVLDFLAEKGSPQGLIVKSPGPAFHAPGRYGKIIGLPVSGDRLARELLLNRRGRHHVKIVQSGLNSLTSFGSQSAPQYMLPDLCAATQAARGLGLPVMVHANGDVPVGIAVEAGASSIEHGFFMGVDNLRRMAEKGTVWVPTVGTMSGYAETLPPGSAEAQIARRIMEDQLRAITLAHGLSVPVATGTDSGSQGVFHGRALGREMALFSRAGFSASEAVAAATAVGARLLGLSDLGLVREGFRASFLAVPGRPDTLLSRIESPFLVVADGNAVFHGGDAGNNDDRY